MERTPSPELNYEADEKTNLEIAVQNRPRGSLIQHPREDVKTEIVMRMYPPKVGAIRREKEQTLIFIRRNGCPANHKCECML
jgi:hypothetical protein